MENVELNMSQLMDKVEKGAEYSEDVIPPTQAAITNNKKEDSST